MPPFGCLQLVIRLNDILQPLRKPYLFSARIVYSEHVGSYKQESRKARGATILYKPISLIESQTKIIFPYEK